MRNSNRVTVSGAGAVFVCLALPGLLAAGKPDLRPAVEAVRPGVETEPEIQQDLEQMTLEEARRREQELLREQEEALQLVVEYIVVGFAPNEQFEHAGNCPLRENIEGDVQPTDIAVLIEGECHGRVGETIQVTRGIFEISADVVDAQMQVVDVEDTTAQQPMIVSIPITRGIPSAPSTPIIIE